MSKENRTAEDNLIIEMDDTLDGQFFRVEVYNTKVKVTRRFDKKIGVRTYRIVDPNEAKSIEQLQKENTSLREQISVHDKCEEIDWNYNKRTVALNETITQQREQINQTKDRNIELFERCSKAEFLLQSAVEALEKSWKYFKQRDLQYDELPGQVSSEFAKERIRISELETLTDSTLSTIKQQIKL